ncbi:MAG: peptidyl-prolyl cis-trans isomerase [Candidatus Omnitrophota bacterium]
MAKLYRLFLVFMVFCHLAPVIRHLYAQDKIIAVVNSEAITQKDLDDFVNFLHVQLRAEYTKEEAEDKIKEMKPDLVNKLIEDRLILQEAKITLEEARKNKNLYIISRLDVEQDKVKARVEEVKNHYGSNAAFQEALASQGFVQADIEKRIKEQLLTYNIIDIEVRGKISVNPGEVTDFYLEKPEEFKTPEERELDSLVIGNQKIAQEISGKLKRGQRLEDLAGEYSLSVNKISLLKDGGLRRDIEEAVFKLSKGEASKPIYIQDKYYIFQLNNIIPPRQQSLSEAQDKIYAFLFNSKMQEALKKWLDEIKKRSYIKICQESA